MAEGSLENQLHYVHSLGFPGLLEKLECILLVTTYQAGKLALFRVGRCSHNRLSRQLPGVSARCG